MNIIDDLKIMLKHTGWSQRMLAKYAEIDLSSLNLLLSGKRKNSIIDKLIPFVYGNKRPPDLPPYQEENKLKRIESAVREIQNFIDDSNNIHNDNKRTLPVHIEKALQTIVKTSIDRRKNL